MSVIWEAKAVEGLLKEEAKDLVKIAVELADGRTASEFAQAALTNPALKAQSAAVFDGSMLSGLIAAGLLALEGDRYKKIQL